MNPQEFVEKLESIDGVEKRHGHYLLFNGRELYVLQDFSGFPSNEVETTAYRHWRNHQSYKLASSAWIPLAGIPVTELAILLNERDTLEGEFREDLGRGGDNSEVTTNPKNYQCGLVLRKGNIIKTKLDSPESIVSLLEKLE